MEHYLSLFIRAVFIENLALSFFLGMCTFLAVSKQIKTAIGLGVAVVLVQAITVPANNLINTVLLKPGALAWLGLADIHLSFPGPIPYIGIIAALVPLPEMVPVRFFPARSPPPRAWPTSPSKNPTRAGAPTGGSLTVAPSCISASRRRGSLRKKIALRSEMLTWIVSPPSPSASTAKSNGVNSLVSMQRCRCPSR